MKCTTLQDGTVTRDQDKILEEQVRFYKGLYTSDQNVEFKYQNDSEIKLNDADKENLDVEITIQEMSKALKNMPNGKSPGCDGLPAEFYKMFWLKIRDVVFENIKFCLEKNTMNLSARRGVITLLPKKDKDISQLKNWRPLTLLNTDYKILAKVIALRIKPYLHALINSDQTGFMTGRFIGENIRNALDIMQIVEEEDIPSLLIAIDFEKCFDRIEWQAIDGAMGYFNFGDNIRKMVKTLYTDIQSCTVNEGWSSEWFFPTRGLRQGCPASPYLFLIVAEILAHKIRENQNIKGIKVNGQEKKLSQFADDTVLFSLFESDSLNGIINTFSHYENNTGLKVNYDKTIIYRIGSLRDSDAKLYTVKEFKWTSNDIDVLGIRITHKNSDQLQVNFDNIIAKTKVIIDSWGNRSLSLLGKKVIINTLIGSLTPYTLSVMRSLKNDMIKVFEELVRGFIWNERRDKIKFGTLKKAKEVGGIKLIDLYAKDLSLKVPWIRRIHQNAFTRSIAEYFIPKLKLLEEKLWQCNINSKDIDGMVTESFYKDVWMAWSKINHKAPKGCKEILEQIIWLNSFIRINNKPVLYKKCIEIGIFYIRDIMTEEKKLMSFDEFSQRYGNVLNYLQYYGLVSAIPIEWKEIISNDIQDENNDKGIDLFNEKQLSKKIYNRLICHNDLTDVRNKCGVHFGTILDANEYEKSYDNLYKITSYTKLRSFQYRLLQNGLVTNKNLYYWKIKDDPLCTFCKAETETISHLFINCNIIARLWTDVKNWIRNKGFNVNVTLNNIVLNNIENKPDHVLNLVVMIVKQYIYRSRCLNVNPNFQELIKNIEEVYKIKKYIAKSQNKIQKYERN